MVLDLGRRYLVVVAGLGVPLRAAADPAAGAVGSLGFGSVVSTTGESSGADGKSWWRIEDRGWAPRDGLLPFAAVRDAVALSIELKAFSPPGLRATARLNQPPRTATATPATAKPGAATPATTPTPTRPTAPVATSTAGPRAVQAALYAVVVTSDARLFERPGIRPLNRRPLEIGTTLTVLEEALAPDTTTYVRLEENQWVRGDAVAIYANLADATEAAFDWTMRALAPGVEVDPRLAPALWILRREPEFRYLAEALRELRVPIKVAALPDPKPLATYGFADRTITFSDGSLDLDPRVLAVALAHEATHAWEHGQGLTPPTGASCFEAELRAFRNQAALWEKFHGPKGRVGARGPEADQNEVLRLMREDPQALKGWLVNVYGDQCAYHGPKPTLVPPKPSIVATVLGPGTPLPGATPGATQAPAKPTVASAPPVTPGSAPPPPPKQKP